jgi:hypothetical protein
MRPTSSGAPILANTDKVCEGQVWAEGGGYPEARLCKRPEIREATGGPLFGRSVPACGKCGYLTYKTVCPVSWPIDTVALTCHACGSVIEYVDGLLVLSFKEALLSHVRRPWVVRGEIAIEPSEYEVAKGIVMMGVDNGLSDQEIAEVMGIDLTYIKALVEVERLRL